MQVKGKSAIDQYVINIVREKRSQRKMSQSELATVLNVSNGFIGQVESSKYPTKYSIEQINIISGIFDCSPKDFFPESTIK